MFSYRRNWCRVTSLILCFLCIFTVKKVAQTTQLFTLDDIQEVRAIDVHPTESTIAIAGVFDTGVGYYIYDTKNGQIHYIQTTGFPGSVAWSPDGSMLVSSFLLQDRTKYQVYSSITGQMISSTEHGPLGSLSTSWNAESTRYAVPTGFDVYGWAIVDARSGDVVTTYSVDGNTRGASLGLSWHGDSVFVLHSRGEVGVWNTNTGNEIHVFELSNNAFTFSLSPDGSMLAVPGSNGEINILDASSGISVKSLISPGGNFVASMAWSPDADSLAAYVHNSSGDGQIVSWNSESGVILNSTVLDAHIAPGQLAWLGDSVVYGSNSTSGLKFTLSDEVYK